MLRNLINRFLLAQVIVSAVLFSVFGQSPDTLWSKIYGGNDYDRGNSMVQTSDEGFAITGETGLYQEAGLFQNGDIWLVRTNSSGDTLWTKTFVKEGFDEGSSINLTSDNGFILSGATTSSNPAREYDAILIRTDENGDTVWIKIFGTTSEDYAVSVKETSDSGFIFTGFTSTQITFSRDVWLVRTDINGDTLWTKTFGGTGEDLGNAVLQTSDGGFLVTGSTREIGNESDLWLIRTDENGDTLWTKRYNGQPSFNSVDEGKDILPDGDGGFYILAQAGVSVWLLHIDENGDTLWTKQHFGTPNDFQQTSDEGFIIAGGSRIIKTDATGDTLWTKNLNGQITSVQQTSNEGFLVAGTIFQSSTLDDLWIARLGSGNATSLKLEDRKTPDQFELFQNYPNPFNPTTKISWQSAVTGWQTLKIYDVLGNEIATLVDEYKPVGTYEIIFDTGKFSSGVYFYQLHSGNFVETKKLVLLR